MELQQRDSQQVRSDLPRWLLVLIALAILAATVLLLVWARSVPGAERIIGDPGMFHQVRPITTLEGIVQEPAKANLLGREVVLDEVRVVRVLGNYTFLVGSETQTVPVILRGELTARQPEGETEIREGQIVRVYGIARLLRSIPEIADMGMLTRNEAEELAEHRVYVSGVRVVVLKD